MLASISEGVLLDRAVAQGLIAAADVAAAQKDHSVQTGPRKWGAVLDRLIAQGKLSDEAVLQSEAGGSAPTSVLPTTTFPAPHWDKYEFIETLGRGGMGAVYRARDRRLGRLVALKFIHGDDPGMIQRFLQEARAQARLDHPYICKVYEVGSVDNKPYIAMELVEGRTLDRASAQLALPEKLQLLKEAAEALHSAHEQGIIHRDIKPSNITTVEKR